MSRSWWTVAGLTILLWSFQLFGYVDAYPTVTLAVVLLGAWGLGTIVVAWHPKVFSAKTARLFALLTLAFAIGAFLLWSYMQVVSIPAYGTDEIAFDQYAAQLLLHGLNPYAHSMAPAFTQFHVSPNGYSFLLNGRPVTSLSYPALSFLVYVPFLAAGWSTQLAVAVNVIAWAIAVILAFALLPRPLRPLAIVLGSFSVYIGYSVGGVTDALFVPLLIGAVFQWDRFVERRGPRSWLGPGLLGLAMAVKQTPWLVLPFLVAGVAIEAKRRSGNLLALKTASRYLTIALITFIVPNAPFALRAPHAWLSGVLTPITSHMVPAGQGLVGLTLFLGLGGGSLSAYSLALVTVFVLLFVAYLVSYPALKPWAVACPAIVLFFSSRSFGSYLVTLLPAAIVAAISIRGVQRTALPKSPGRQRTSYSMLWLGLGAAAVGSAVVAIFVSRPPLTIDITSVRTTGQLATVVQLGVNVTNNSGRPEKPAFTVESGGDISAFWIAEGGPPIVAPGAHVHYSLLAPHFFAQPPISGGFQVVAFTSSPASVSSSRPYVPTTYHLTISPDAVSQFVPVGKVVVFHAQILDKLNRPVPLANQPVYLGQIIYDQQGLLFGQAVINGGQVGQTPMVAYTNRFGNATFYVRGTQVTADPVYFEANLVKQDNSYPYGYSEIVPIRFSAGAHPQ